MHSTLVHLDALVETRDGQKGKRATDKDRKRYLGSQWHQFASRLSNDGFCMTRHNLG